MSKKGLVGYVFSRWLPFVNLKNKVNNLVINKLGLKTPSQNRIFVENRPFPREFEKELAFG